MRARWLLLVPVLCAGPVLAQERKPAFEGDSRLDRRVTVHWKKATLYDAFQELSRATGVRLSPERSLVDEPLMASATNIPARDLLTHVARLLHYTWARSGGTPESPTYLLYQDKRSHQEEDDEVNGSRRAVYEALQQELERYRRVARLSPEQLQGELEKADRELSAAFSGGLAGLQSDPAAARRIQDGQAVRVVASPVGRAMLDFVASLTPDQWTQLQADRPLVFSSGPTEGELRLPAAIQDRLREARPEIPFPKALFKSFGAGLDEAIGKVEQMMQEQWGRSSGFKVTVQLRLNLGAQPVGMLSVAPQPLDASEIGPAYMATGLMLAGAPQLLAPPEEDPAAREKRLAADPLLGKKVVLKLPEPETQTGFLAMMGKAHRVADLLPLIETAYGVNLVGDAYNRQAMTMVPPFGEREVPLYKVLDAVTGMTRRWERDGTVIRLRSRTWAHDRRAEIPVRYMRRWIEARDRKGALSLDDLAEIATLLRDEQVESLMFSAMEADTKDLGDFITIPMSRDILRFYGRLLPAQRRLLQAGRPLAAADLFPYQQALLIGLSQPRNPSMFAFAMGTRPQRSPDRLARARVTLDRQVPPQVPLQAPPGQPAAGKAPAAMAPFNQQVRSTYTFRVAFPDGQKDDYAVILMSMGAAGAATAPASPPRAVPVPAPPAPPVVERK